MGEHLESAARQRARAGLPPPAELEGPECPGIAAHLWQWWQELDQVRRDGGFGAQGLDYRDIRAWAWGTRTRPGAFEIRVLLELDQVYRRSLAERGDQATKKKE